MSARRITPILFLLLMLVPLPFLPEFGGANSSTRIMLSAALVDERTTRIDRYAALTVDKAEHEGHFYSDKAPGMAFLAMPVYAAGRALDPDAAAALFQLETPLDALPRETALLWRMVSWLTGGLLMALAGAALFRAFLRLGGDARAALLASLTVCLATPVLGWSVQFFGHVGAGAALAVAFALATGIGRENTWLGPALRAMIAAAALSLAVSIEYTAAPPALMVALYALWRLTRLPRGQMGRLFGVALAAALVAAAPMLIYHYATFGSPFRVGYSNVVGFEGMQQGFLGLTAPDPVVLWRILFGFKRGILWLSPILVLVPFGLWLGWRRQHLRMETVLCGAVIAYYFLLNASYFYWSGGSSVGPRHTMPAMFFAGLPLMLVGMHWQTGRAQLALRGLFALSLVFSLACAAMTMTVTARWRFPLKDPILENLLGPDSAFARMAVWGLPPVLTFALWLAVSAGLGWLAWRAASQLR